LVDFRWEQEWPHNTKEEDAQGAHNNEELKELFTKFDNPRLFVKRWLITGLSPKQDIGNTNTIASFFVKANRIFN
jgi:hypothetical protein